MEQFIYYCAKGGCGEPKVKESQPFEKMWVGRPRKGIRVRPDEYSREEEVPRRQIRIGDLSSDPIGLITTDCPEPRGERLEETRKPGDPAVAAGDLVIIVAGSTPRCAVADERAEGCTISPNLVAVTLRPEYSPYYTCWYLNSPNGQHQFAQRSVGSVVTRSIPLKGLGEMEIALPPPEARGEIYALYQSFYEHERKLAEERDARTRILNEIVRRAEEGVL